MIFRGLHPIFAGRSIQGFAAADWFSLGAIAGLSLVIALGLVSFFQPPAWGFILILGVSLPAGFVAYIAAAMLFTLVKELMAERRARKLDAGHGRSEMRAGPASSPFSGADAGKVEK